MTPRFPIRAPSSGSPSETAARLGENLATEISAIGERELIHAGELFAFYPDAAVVRDGPIGRELYADVVLEVGV